MLCISYCISTIFETHKFHKAIKNDFETKFYKEVLFVNFKNSEVFVFPYGAFVIWTDSKNKVRNFIDLITPFASQLLPSPISEDFTFSYNEKTNVKQEKFTLHSKDPSIKLAISYGLAQSVKMDVFEDEIEYIIKRTKFLPKELAENGKISLSRKKISKEIGKLFLAKHYISLHIEILDVPDIFWDHPNLESIYEDISQYLDLSTRNEVLDRRLEMVNTLLQMLSNELNYQHSAALEWIIICLIIIEVIISLSKDVFHLL